MEAQETLNLISKQWYTLEDLMVLGEFDRNSTLKVKTTFYLNYQSRDFEGKDITLNRDEHEFKH